MADYYSMTSFVIPTHTEEQQKWLLDLFEQLSKPDLEELVERGEIQFPKEFQELVGEIYLDESYAPDEYKAVFNGVHVWEDELVDAQLLGLVIRAYLKRFRPDSFFSFTFAETCSNMQPGAFGGGAVVVTANDHKIMITDDWIYEQLYKLKKGGGSHLEQLRAKEEQS